MRGLPFALVTLLLPACTVAFSMHSAFHWSVAELRDHTGTEAFELRCPSEATVVRLGIRADAASGSLRLCLRDPSGQVVYEDLLQSGLQEAVMQWPARRGCWRGEMSFVGFSGGVGLDVVARDEPLRVQITATRIEVDSNR